MRNPGVLWTLALAMFFLDLYMVQALKVISQGAGPRAKYIILTAYWGISGVALVLLILMPFLHLEAWPRFRNYLFAVVFGLFIAKLVAALFFLLDDIRRLLQWAFGKLSARDRGDGYGKGEGISRSSFLSWIGIGIGGSVYGSLLYGFSNKYNYEVRRVRLTFENLPPAFRGLRIVQLSDIHSGSFGNKAAVQKGIDRVMKEKADLILFTGDLVNDRAVEMNDYREIFGQLRAPLGVYSTLGNHDYGDYVPWESREAKIENLQAVMRVHGDMGWRLLMNEHVVLEKEGQQIALLGIENWSAKARFPKHGRMNLAYAGTEKIPFKILMSHDPSHWDAEVRPHYPDIDLALAGHTHGMQFGVELPGLRWSPVQYVYKQWAGLYEEGRQKLYVNRGFGFIGYPGRVGILPEITVIELG